MRSRGCGVLEMSTGTSVPKPRLSGMDASDSALLAMLLSEAPIGFAFIDSDLRFRRVNRALAQLSGVAQAGHAGGPPPKVWPKSLGPRAEWAVRRVLAEDQPLL